MRVLVTGGAGFVGSHVVDALAERGHDVVVVDRLHPRAHAAPPGYLREDVEYLLGDRPGRLVLASSMVVYGEGAYRCARHGAVRPGPRERARLEAGLFEPTCHRCRGELAAVPIGEDAPPDPRNVYAATKLHQEHLAQASMREGGPAVTALRYHNVYGPRMPAETPYSGVAAIFRSALAAGRPPRLLEDGAQRRDFVHVRDDRKSTRLNSSHEWISYAVFCLK